MIISFLSQKGGVGKSTLARGTAIEYVKSDFDVHIADMDTEQLSTLHWASRREKNNIKPVIDVATYRTPESALKSVRRCELLIVDGTPYATSDTLKLANHSNMVVIPTGVTHDDLEPSLKLAQELTLKTKLSRKQILLVIMKVPDKGSKEAESTRESITDWGFDTAPGWMPFRTGYGKAMDSGLSMTETRYASLNEKADLIIQSIADHLTVLEQ